MVVVGSGRSGVSQKGRYDSLDWTGLDRTGGGVKSAGAEGSVTGRRERGVTMRCTRRE